ncbi:hypothetical protein [Haloferula sp. BvORR071]|uniref:type IV pilus modification PilV family protein n=1 Tax=Haloferula sp. BvORR071 TaxID=1396141 RepID=UPI000551D173|nr:hypothetical protein [Haloferula sp. BvORR071]
MLERPRHFQAHAAGFTLPAVVIVAAALLILAVGLLSIIGIERKTARSFADAKRAELAARAGLEDFRAILRKETANDDYLVISGQSPNKPSTSVLESPAQLFIARGSGGGDKVSYRYQPLFSTQKLPQSSGGGILKAPPIDQADEGSEDYTPVKALPWQDAPRVQWVPVQDEKGETVARYAYWVEDLQGKVDAKTAGSENLADTPRNAWPFPASGINPEAPSDTEPKLKQIAIHALDPAAGEADTAGLTRKIVDGRPLMLSPESVAAAAGFAAPLKRKSDGLLENPIAAGLERSASAAIQPYEELATVPYAPGISTEVAGRPKLNLNLLLSKPRPTAIDEFASWIKNGLPDFESRKGGFPDDYLRTLAANAFDYADADNDPSFAKGVYRGLDGYPLVSEFLMSFHWDGVTRENNRTFINFTVGTFAELWNMTDQPVEGMAQISFETKFDFQLGANPSVSFEEYAIDKDAATPVLSQSDGYTWHEPFPVTLRPNEMRVYAKRVVLKIDAGPASLFVPSPLQINSNGYDREAGYRLRWNGQLVDQSRAQMWKSGGSVYYPDDTEKKSRQFVRATIPAHSHASTSSPDDFRNNMGDPRMAFYLTDPQTRNNYPNNYSPNRRNIRWENVYKGDGPTKPLIYGRVLPSEWPDLGHDAPYGTRPSVSADDQRINPDDPKFFQDLPTPQREQAPLRLSNQGRFYSATELGRVYDPIMWRPTYAKLADTNSIRAGTLPGTQTAWPDVNLGAPASSSYGGGNTLRIGRAEHPLFDRAGVHAALLLDLFTAGKGTSGSAEEREGHLVDMRGAVNLNTATADAIRALAVGMLKQDPLLSQVPSKNHQTTNLMAAPTSPLDLGTPTRTKAADRLAEAIIRSRPFNTSAAVAAAKDSTDKPVFGNREMYTEGNKIQWTDSAAEEVFARIYEASTLRSRNFRVWVVGQAIYTPPKGSGRKVEVLSESKKSFTVFADPGERKQDGTIDTSTYRPRVTHENDF